MTDYTYITILAENTIILPVIIKALFSGLGVAFSYLITAGYMYANKRTTMAINQERWDNNYFEDMVCDDLTEEEIILVEALDYKHDWTLTEMRKRVWNKDVLDADNEEDEETVRDIPVWHHMPPVPAGHGADLAEYFRS